MYLYHPGNPSHQKFLHRKYYRNAEFRTIRQYKNSCYGLVITLLFPLPPDLYHSALATGTSPQQNNRTQSEPAPLPVRHSGKKPALFQKGLASWYGGQFHNRRTAQGTRFDSRAMTAAHPFLPFGTRLLVHSPRTGKSVVVKVNDRGPYVDNRVIDLSRSAAEKLGILRAGVSPVTISVLNRNTTSDEVSQMSNASSRHP